MSERTGKTPSVSGVGPSGRVSRAIYKPHDGPHEWSLPVRELGGRRACRNCGHIASGREDFFSVQRARRKQEVVDG